MHVFQATAQYMATCVAPCVTDRTALTPVTTGVMYARYRPEKLLEHLKLFSTRLNIPRLIRVCDEQQHWKELTYLYITYDEYDNAAGAWGLRVLFVLYV